MSNLNKFIEEELIKRKALYLSSPTYLIEHYESEKQNIQAYNGRQLLEMLQNADDASESATDKAILIELKDNILTIANNGDPFNEDGFRSILYSCVSPKTLQQNKIGQKGLGFRSILSWAEEVIIYSGGTKLAFSEKIAKLFLESLLKESEELSNFIKLKSKSKMPIATLRVPKLLNGDKDSENCFDTIISIKLKENIIDDVQSQILSVINKETLIFLNHIKTIKIDSPKRGITFYKSYTDNTKKRVTVKSVDIINDLPETKTWDIKRRFGKHKEKEFELAIAWNDELDESENVLFSYFKTEVRFPFPALLHGTFELTQDRNQLVNDTEGHNEFLTGELSMLLIEAALEIASKHDEVNYLPLKLLNIDFDKVDSVLQNFNFKETLIDKIKASNIFPSVNKSYNTYAADPVFYDHPVALIVQGDDVDNLMPICNDESVLTFIKTFPIYHYSAEKFISIIANRATKLDVRELAKLFYYFLEYEPYKKDLQLYNFELSNLDCFLLDSDNTIINWDSNIFIQPQDTKEFNLPKSLNIRFLNQDFVNALLQEFEIDNIDVLLNKLKPFGIKRYSFSEISKILIQHYNSKEKIITKDVLNLHAQLFIHFENELKSENPLPLLHGIDTPVVSRARKIINAKEVYFGNHFGNTITEQLFKYDKSKLIASPKTFGLGDVDKSHLKKYFKWLGVAELPRKIRTGGSSEFTEYALKRFNYKNKISEYQFINYDKFKSSLNHYGTVTVQSIEELESILNNNNSESIIAWLCTDDSIYKFLENDFEPQGSSILVRMGRDTKYREIHSTHICNFLKWKLSNFIWLNTQSGIKQAPTLCTTSATISSDFSPLIEKPHIDYDAHILKDNNINPDKVDYLLHLVGVNKTISSFETKILYSLLNKLPEIDSEGKKARTLYRELAVNYDERNLDPTEVEYNEFISNGKVFCSKHGKFGYENPRSVFYVDNKRYGESIISQFHTIAIERRKNQDKIKKVFGVKPLKGLKLSLAGSPDFHNLNEIFEQEIEFFKPYVYVFRQDRDTTGKEKNFIKDVRLKLVTDLNVLLERENEKTAFKLSFYEYLYLPENKIIYIRTPEHLDDERKLKDDINFCSTIAEAFSALIDVDAQRQQIRELFSKSLSSRDDIIRTELDDINLEKLTFAKNKLGIVNDPKIHFWVSFIKCFPAKEIQKERITDEELVHELKKLFPKISETISNCFDKINYDNYNEEASLKLIVELLNESNLSLQDFNRYAYPSINISELYYLDFKRIRESKKTEFKKVLYSMIINSERDKKDFLNMQYQYDTLTGIFQNEIGYDVETDLNIQLLEHFKIELREIDNINFEQIYFLNKSLYEKKTEKENIATELAYQFLDENPDLESLLYFKDEVNNLIEGLKDWVSNSNNGDTGNSGGSAKKKRLSIGDSAFFYDDFTDLFNQLESDGAFKTNLFKVKIRSFETDKSNSNKNRKPSTKRSRNPKKFSKDLGFLGEWLVYKHLLTTIKNNESIKWVSEYAKLVGVNLDGKDGLGYDIEYIPNDAKYLRYVEVKLVGQENAFHISSNEIYVGEKLKKHYEIFLVRNIAEPDNIIIERIQGPFDYKGHTSFTDNDLFNVTNNNFILKFEKTDA